MKKITALRQAKNKKNRVNVYLDGKFTGSLEQGQVSQAGLAVGLELSGDRLESFMHSLHTARCLDAASRYLTYRPRSATELKERLLKRGFPAEQIEVVINKLKEQKLVDDTRFAEFWKDNRAAFSPRSRWLTGRELAQKGVEADVISQVVAGIDEDESAYQAVISRASRLNGYPYEVFRQKLGNYLQRRGFSFEVINRTVKKVWEEIKQ